MYCHQTLPHHPPQSQSYSVCGTVVIHDVVSHPVLMTEDKGPGEVNSEVVAGVVDLGTKGTVEL